MNRVDALEHLNKQLTDEVAAWKRVTHTLEGTIQKLKAGQRHFERENETLTIKCRDLLHGGKFCLCEVQRQLDCLKDQNKALKVELHSAQCTLVKAGADQRRLEDENKRLEGIATKFNTKFLAQRERANEVASPPECCHKHAYGLIRFAEECGGRVKGLHTESSPGAEISRLVKWLNQARAELARLKGNPDAEGG